MGGGGKSAALFRDILALQTAVAAFKQASFSLMRGAACPKRLLIPPSYGASPRI
jgi:hypothetical protein